MLRYGIFGYHNNFSKKVYHTPPIAEILCVKNVGHLWVLNEMIKEIYAENMKKIVGAVWELPVK